MTWHYRRANPSKGIAKALRYRNDKAHVEKGVGDYYIATAPDGAMIRLNRNADGSEYIPRPWHSGKDKPPIKRFPSAAAAMRYLDRYYPERPV